MARSARRKPDRVREAHLYILTKKRQPPPRLLAAAPWALQGRIDPVADPDRRLRVREDPAVHTSRRHPQKFPYDFLIVGSKSSRNAATSILFEREDLRMAGRTRIFYGPRERTAALDQAYKWSSKAPFHLTGSK